MSYTVFRQDLPTRIRVDPVLLHGVVCSQGCVDLDASVAWPAFEHVRVVAVEEAVEQHRDGGGAPSSFP